MALMFTRLANNFLKAGYYPTDADTLGRALTALAPGAAHARILDPCCGEGCALAEVAQHLRELGCETEALGVEFDRERAWHAKRLLDRAIHSDIHDVVVTPRSTGLLFLNPPYGYGLADTANATGPAERLEMAFLRKTVPTLAYGGVLVLIVPHYVVDKEMAAFLGRNFDRLQSFRAPEQRFQQCVIFGTKLRSRTPTKDTLTSLDAVRDGSTLAELPESWLDEPYRIPDVCVDDFRFQSVRVDGEQLHHELQRHAASTLWPHFSSTFGAVRQSQRRPLRDLSSWHLALALAAGQITGIVESAAGRRLLIKGDTFKQKHRSTTIETDEDGGVSETVVMTDRFVPVINAIDFTPGPTLGRIITIR